MTDRDLTQPAEDADNAEFAEESGSLWRITLAPLTWAVHFVVCYALIATSCARGWPVETMRQGLLIFTVAALALIGWIGLRAWRQWNVTQTGDFVNRRGVAEDRHHFLGHAAFLLSVISLIGVVFVAMPLAILGGCR